MQDESGATAIEYGLAEIALAIITVGNHIGTKLNKLCLAALPLGLSERGYGRLNATIQNRDYGDDICGRPADLLVIFMAVIVMA